MIILDMFSNKYQATKMYWEIMRSIRAIAIICSLGFCLQGCKQEQKQSVQATSTKSAIEQVQNTDVDKLNKILNGSWKLIKYENRRGHGAAIEKNIFPAMTFNENGTVDDIGKVVDYKYSNVINGNWVIENENVLKIIYEPKQQNRLSSIERTVEIYFVILKTVANRIEMLDISSRPAPEYCILEKLPVNTK